jgi:hypothetical protein
MRVPRGYPARIIAAAMLVVLAGCAAPAQWQLVSGMDGDTKHGTAKLCQLVRKDSSRSLVIGHKRIPDEPELGYVYFLFRAPELILESNMHWTVTLQFDTGSRTGHLSAMDEDLARIEPDTLLLKEIFRPMETASTLDVTTPGSEAVVHFDLAGLPEALPALRACADEGVAI